LGDVGCFFASLADERQQHTAFNGLSCLDVNIEQHAIRRGWHFGIDLIGADFQQRFEFFDGVAYIFQPAADRAFDHTFAQLRHNHFCRHY
jgi:hypothetical protein